MICYDEEKISYYLHRKFFLLLRRDFDFPALMKFFPTEVFLMIGPPIPEILNGKECVRFHGNNSNAADVLDSFNAVNRNHNV